MSGSGTIYTEQSVLGHTLGFAPMAFPVQVFVGLCSAAMPPSETVRGVEAFGGGYTRMPATFALIDTPANIAANVATVEYPIASGAWGTLGYFELWDAAVGGNRLYWGALIDTASQLPITITVASGDIVRFSAGTLAVQAATGAAGTGSVGAYLPLAGGTLLGPLLLASDPTTYLQAATKQYVDAHSGTGGGPGFLPLSGGTMLGTLTLAADAVASLQPVTLEQLNAAVDVTAAGGTAALSLQNRFKDLRTPYDFGAQGSTATTWHDDTAALNAAFAQLGSEGGGRLYIPGIFYAAGALTVPEGVEIYGDFATTTVESAAAKTFFQMEGSKLILGTSGITLNKACILRNAMVIASSVATTNPTNITQAQAIITAMASAGTGINIVGQNCLVDTVQVLGFNYGINATTGNGINHLMLRNIHGDCTNGIYLANGGDTCRIQGAHFWPYLTFTAGPTGGAFQRSGYGIYTSRSGCLVDISQCMVYGWQTCFMCDTDAVSWVQCWADGDGNAPQGTGYATIGACRTAQMSNCVAVANQYGVHHAPSNGAVFNITGSFLVGGGPGGVTLATESIAVLANGSGPVQCTGSYFEGGNYGFYLGSTSGPSVIIGNVFDDIAANWGAIWNVDPAVVPVLIKHSNRVINSGRGLTEQSPVNPATGAALYDSLPFPVTQLTAMAGITARGPIALGSGATVTPSMEWVSAGNGTDQNVWDALAGSTMSFRAVNDAASAANPWLSVSRTGYVPQTIALAAVGIALNGRVGFNSTAPIAKPTVSGSKGSNAALASLMTALAAYGLVTDTTT